MQQQRKQINRRMQSLIAGMLSIWALFLLSSLVAWFRVANKEQFEDKPYKSFPLEGEVFNRPTGF